MKKTTKKTETNEQFYKVTCRVAHPKMGYKTLSFVSKIKVSPKEFEMKNVFDEDYVYEDFMDCVYQHLEKKGNYEKFNIEHWADSFDYDDYVCNNNGSYLIIEQEKITDKEYKNSNKWKAPKDEDLKDDEIDETYFW